MSNFLAKTKYHYSFDTAFGTITLSCSGTNVIHIHIDSTETDSNHYDVLYKRKLVAYDGKIEAIKNLEQISSESLFLQIQSFQLAIDDYCRGKITQFTQADWINHVQASAWQKSVMRAMREIPAGKTLSYGEVSVRLTGSKNSSRAVGLSCASNPLPLIYPCHRVVGHDGSMTGFGFGIENKKKLLKLENANHSNE